MNEYYKSNSWEIARNQENSQAQKQKEMNK